LAGDEGAVAEFRMPSLGADMEAGTLVEWLVKPGDWVKRGDIVAVVETQKVQSRLKSISPVRSKNSSSIFTARCRSERRLR
jgi:predicted deacylase